MGLVGTINCCLDCIVNLEGRCMSLNGRVLRVIDCLSCNLSE